MSENKQSDIIRTSLESIKQMLDANTVLGTPVQGPNGTVVIPVSKVTVGYASGGVDFNSKKAKEEGKSAPSNFGGGGGTGVTVVPVAFIVIDGEGKAELLNLNAPAAEDTVSKIVSLIEQSPELFKKIKGFFSKKKPGTFDYEDEDDDE